MPNHVTNRLTIKGDAAAVLEIRKSCFTVHQKEIPDHWHKLAGDPDHPDHEKAKGWIAERKANPTYTAFDFNKIIPAPAFISTDSLDGGSREEATGRNWYKWNTNNWGTKWNAYDNSIVTDVQEDATGEVELVFTFDTAWNTPKPIIETLASWFPELHFHHEFFDEGWNFAGTRTYSDGKMTEVREPKSKEDPEMWNRLCRELKGYDPEAEDA